MTSATVAQTQGPQGTVSIVLLEDEKQILVALKELRDLLSRYAPRLLNVFKIKSLLTLVAENFFSEMSAGSYDMPLQLQFDFRFSRALKEHLKQMCRTKFCYSTSAKSHYPRVQSILQYSDLPKMFPPSSVHLFKSQVQKMRDWRIKHGQSLPQKTVRNMSTKDNPRTLPVNLYFTEQSSRQPIDFCAIGKSNQGSATGKENPINRVHSRESIVYLASDASSSSLKLYVL